jgi:hypothetical protein
MDKLNVNLGIQVRVKMGTCDNIIVTNGKRLLVIVKNVHKAIGYCEIFSNGEVSEIHQCQLTSDFDDSDNWFNRIGTGNVNKSNIGKGLSIIKKGGK